MRPRIGWATTSHTRAPSNQISRASARPARYSAPLRSAMRFYLSGMRGKSRGDFLAPAVVGEVLFVIETERLEHRRVVDREEHRVFRRGSIRVLVQRPGGLRDDAAFAPFKALAVDDRLAFAFDDVINRAAGVAMCARALARTQHLNLARHRRHHGSAGLRVAIFEADAVIGTAFLIAHRLQRRARLLP